MSSNSVVFTFLVIVCLCLHFGLASKKVLLSSVQTLTLHSDKFTTGRRSSPIPQLRCIDGKSSCKNLPSAVQCYNMGSDGLDVQWKCEAQLPQSTQFDTLQVQCEGYDYPDDPYVLAGSCGLTYSLKPAGSSSKGHKSHKSHSRSTVKSEDKGLSISIVVILVICCLAIYFFCLAPSAARRRAEPSAPMPPASDDYGAPPPYSEGGVGAPQYGFRPEYTDNTGSGKAYERRTYQQQQQPDYSSTDYNRDNQRADNNNSGPGFWTGAAVGALGGYLFGSSGNSRSSNDCNYRAGYGDSTYTTYSRESSSSSSDGGDTPATRTGYASTRRR